MKTKPKVPTDKEQRIVANILTAFMFAETMEDVMKVWKEVYSRYNLFDDPFTRTPCSYSDFCKNHLEYEKQTMVEKYGHCDGLE